MPNAFPSQAAASPVPGRDAAFVVHLAPAPDALAFAAHGRVEHVTTGRTARFVSADELVRFMQDTLASLQDGRAATKEAR